MIESKEFWDRCIRAGCTIGPIKIYSKYNDDGNTSENDFIGVKFISIYYDMSLVGPKYWSMIEDQYYSFEDLYETPEAALYAWEERKKRAELKWEENEKKLREKKENWKDKP